MATQNLVEDEGIFYFLREQYGSVDNALAANPNAWAGTGAWPGLTDEASLREALEGPQHDQIIAILIGLAKAPPPAGYDRVGADIQGNALRQRTETVDNNETVTIHAEKNQDIEVENDETHFAPGAVRAGVWDDTDIVHVLDDDGPTTLLNVRPSGESGLRAWDGDYGFDGVRTTSGAHEGHVWGDPHVNEVVGQVDQVTGGDFNGDGPDTLGFGDANGDGMVDAADYVL